MTPTERTVSQLVGLVRVGDIADPATRAEMGAALVHLHRAVAYDSRATSERMRRLVDLYLCQTLTWVLALWVRRLMVEVA